MAGGAIAPAGASLAEYWNGSKWSIQKTADRPGSYQGSFNGVACTSIRTCIAVGASTAPVSALLTATSPLAERWDGTGWSRMRIAVPLRRPLSTYSALEGVSCVSRTACVAVGTRDDQSNLIELLTGQDWMFQTPASAAGAETTGLGGVSCSGMSCNAVGAYTTQNGAFAQVLTSTVMSTPVVSTPAGVKIVGLRASPLGKGCVTEVGTSEREANAVIADATCRHFRLTVNGIIEVGGRLVPTARGTVIGSIRVKLPGGPANATTRVMVAGGRWRFSLVVPGVNLDPVPPSYLIVVHFGGANSEGPVSAERRICIESEPAGL
jgi:hypothetical protein